MLKTKHKPFLKWVGGKTRLLKQLNKYLPNYISEKEPFIYVEPFLGGGAMFYHLLNNYNIKQAHLNDINKKLVSTYIEIKNNVDELIVVLQSLEQEYNDCTSHEKKKKFYLKKRKIFNSLNKCVEKSALLIFLNKTCFNGMYRENSKGEFNVPFGAMKSPKICNKKLLLDLNRVFQNVEFTSKSFEKTFLKKQEFPIFYYLDPPYRAISKTSSFKDYSSENNFNDSLQKKLSFFCDKINSSNGSFLQSNSYSQDRFFQNLYKNFNQKEIVVSRTIGADGAKRNKIKELIIYNYG